MRPSYKEDEVSASTAFHRSNYNLSDFFNNFDEVSVNIQTVSHIFRKDRLNFIMSCINFSNLRLWLYCIVCSMMIAVSCFLIEYFGSWFVSHRKHNLSPENDYSSLLLWVFSALILATVSTGLCHVYGSEAQGAGVPELKCIITGSRMYEYLEFRVLIAKFFGMITALGAGFTTGRIGPNMHIGAMIFCAFSKVSFFKEMKRDSVLRNQSLMIGGALGLCCSFGTPFTGLVVIVELAEKISSGRTLWILYVGLFFSIVTYKMLIFSANMSIIIPLSHIWQDPYRELIEFSILGVLCGLYGALFIRFMIWFQYLKNKYTFLKLRYTYTWISIIIISLLQFKFNLLRIDDKTLYNDLFGEDALDPKYFTHPHEVISLLFLLSLKSLMFFLTITAPIPAGIFAPLMLMGGILGRLYGHVLKIVLGNINISKYAVAGAAAVSAVTTRLLCMTVLIVEITEDVNITFLIMVTVLFAYGTGNLFTKSFFSSNIELRKLPYSSKLMKHEVYLKTVQQIMNEPKIFLCSNSKIRDIYEILKDSEKICVGDFIPIVEEQNEFKFKGTIKLAYMIKYMKNELKCVSISSHQGWMNKLHTWLEIYTFLEEESEYNSKDIISRAHKIGTQIKAKRIFQLENLKQLFTKKPNKNDFEMQETILKENSIVDESYSLDSFLDKDINLMDPLLKFDPSPLTVNLTMNLCKLHYLFINLGVSTIFVIEDGVLQGIIKKTHFLELNTQVRKSLGKL